MSPGFPTLLACGAHGPSLSPTLVFRCMCLLLLVLFTSLGAVELSPSLVPIFRQCARVDASFASPNCHNPFLLVPFASLRFLVRVFPSFVSISSALLPSFTQPAAYRLLVILSSPSHHPFFSLLFLFTQHLFYEQFTNTVLFPRSYALQNSTRRYGTEFQITSPHQHRTRAMMIGTWRSFAGSLWRTVRANLLPSSFLPVAAPTAGHQRRLSTLTARALSLPLSTSQIAGSESVGSVIFWTSRVVSGPLRAWRGFRTSMGFGIRDLRRT